MWNRNHAWITKIILLGTLTLCIQAAQLRFYQGSLTTYTAVPLEDSLNLLPLFNKTRVSIFYIFGYNELANGNSSMRILSAYLRKNYANVIQLDWEKEAEDTGQPRSYEEIAIPNAKRIGNQLGRAIVTLIENGISENKIHLIGHSLGAHLCGYAGTVVQNFNYNLSRITGLDPAGPNFEGAFGNEGLNASNAQFVDVLHTNPGIAGISQSVGTVDFWANCESSIQPGCCLFHGKDESPALCSHNRSWKLYAESVTSPFAFPAVSAENCAQWIKTNGNQSYVNYLGDLVNTSARGNFYFSTNSHCPYAKEQEGLIPNNWLITDFIKSLFCSLNL